MIVTNDKSYASPKDKVHKLTVEFILDIVPGTFAQPEDLMNWIASNPYVKTVKLEKN